MGGARVKIRAINTACRQNFMKVLYKNPEKIFFYNTNDGLCCFFDFFLPLAAINGGARVKIRAINTAHRQHFETETIHFANQAGT